MHFRSSYLVRALAIRTRDNGVANTYEDSEIAFYLGGPHEVVVRMRNAGEGERHQAQGHEHYLVCEATGRWTPSSPQVQDGFQALREGRVPNRAETLEEAKQEFAQAYKEEQISGYSLPWDALPPFFKTLLTK